MTKINNIIELNGKRFDARTGAFLGSQSAEGTQPAATTAKVTTPKAHAAPNGRAMDGIVGKPAGGFTKVAAMPVKPAPPNHATAHHVHTPKPLMPHQPQHSQTLMRRALKQPAIKSTKPLHAQAPADPTKFQPKVLSVKPKLSSDQIDKSRAERAGNVPRSPQLVRFQPAHQPIRRNFTVEPAATPASVPVNPARPQAQPPQRDMFEAAIANARSHEEPAPKESRRPKAKRTVRRHVRRFSISTAVVVMLLLGGFFAYQNKIALELQLASARAGFPASMPGYRPSGYAAKSLKYSPGMVTIGYRGGDHSFNVTQKQSNWDSETLLQNYVADANQSYQAYEAAGRTVYVYGNNATWVNGGVWYQVNGNASLTTKQFLDIATSM